MDGQMNSWACLWSCFASKSTTRPIQEPKIIIIIDIWINYTFFVFKCLPKSPKVLVSTNFCPGVTQQPSRGEASSYLSNTWMVSALPSCHIYTVGYHLLQRQLCALEEPINHLTSSMKIKSNFFSRKAVIKDTKDYNACYILCTMFNENQWPVVTRRVAFTRKVSWEKTLVLVLN